VATRPVPIEILLNLVAQLALGLAALALVLRLAYAQDRRQPRLECLRDLELQRLVGLVEVLAAFGVAEHDAVHVDLGQHHGGDLAGERALVGLVHRLRVDRYLRAARGVDQRLERQERRADDDLDTVDGGDAR
jgi:hypothetical protein